MTEVLQTNIFFLITSASVVALTLLLCIAAVYVIKILRAVSRITSRIDEKSEMLAEDIKQLRSYVAERSLISQIIGLFAKSSDLKPKRRKKKDD